MVREKSPTLLSKYRIEIKYGLIAFTLLASLFALNQTQALSGLDALLNNFFDLMTDLGFVGCFLVALLANSSLLIQIPYTMPLLSIALSGASLNHLLVMGVASGMGAGFGEVITYGIAEKILGENPALEKSSLFQWVQRMVNSHPRTAPLLVFVWAVLPVPDDTVIIPLAMVHYGLKRMSLPLFTGKVVHSLIVAVVFYHFTDWSAGRVSGHVQVDLAVGIIIAFVLVIFYQIEKIKQLAAVEARVMETQTS